jgi:hypothetical protein
MSKKKQFFAQNNKLDAFNHRAKNFWTIEEAEEWLKTEGGGTVKKRNAGVVYVFGEPVRVWGEVLNV